MRYWEYLLALSFSFLGAKLVNARYGVNISFGTIAAFFAFSLSWLAYNYLDAKILTSIQNKSDCADKMIGEVVKDYKPEVLAPQIAVLINNDLGQNSVVRQEGMNYVIEEKIGDMDARTISLSFLIKFQH
jgi:hypothetical protein